MRELAVLYTLKEALDSVEITPLELKNLLEKSLQLKEPLPDLISDSDLLDSTTWAECLQRARSHRQWPERPTNINSENRLLARHLLQSPLKENSAIAQRINHFLKDDKESTTSRLYQVLLKEFPALEKKLPQALGVLSPAFLHCQKCNFAFYLSTYYPWWKYPCLFCDNHLAGRAHPPLEQSHASSDHSPETTHTPGQNNSGLVHSVGSPGSQTSPVLEDFTSDGIVSSRLGRYKIEAKLGQGGMGAVYRAYDPDLERRVALKVITSQVNKDRGIERFRREVRLTANLRHPNIVPVYEAGEDQGRPYYTMSYVPGQSLREYLREKGPLEEEEALEFLTKITSAVEYAHSKGVLHRDIKPENIMIDSEGEPLLMDFGLAKKVDDTQSLTQTGAIVGSPEFMAPEQALGEKKIGCETDIYALGGVLFYALTGRPPFEGSDSMQILLQVIEDPPPPLRNLNSQISREMEVVVGKCLRKEARHRYPNGAMLLYDLKALAQGEPIVARPPTLFQRGSRWLKKHRTLSLALLVLATALVLGTFSWWRQAHLEAVYQTSLEEAKIEAQEGRHFAAFLRFQTLLGENPRRQAPWQGLKKAALHWAGSAVSRYDWKERAKVLNHLKNLRSQDFLSRARKKELNEMIKKIKENQVGHGIFELIKTKGDPRGQKTYYLFDEFKQKVMAIEYGKKYRLLPREYFLFSPQVYGDTYFFRLAPGKETRFQFKTVLVPKDYASLSRALSQAKWGWRIRLQGGKESKKKRVHRENVLITQSHISLEGEKGAVLDGGGYPALMIKGARDIAISRLKIRNRGRANIHISDSRHINLFLLNLINRGRSNLTVKNSRHINLWASTCRLAHLARIEYRNTYGANLASNTFPGYPQEGISLVNCQKIRVHKNRFPRGQNKGKVALRLTDTIQTVLSKNRIENFQTAILLNGSTHGVGILSNLCRKNGRGIVAFSAGGFFWITGNSLVENRRAAIRIQASHDHRRPPLRINHNILHKNRVGLSVGGTKGMGIHKNWFTENKFAYVIYHPQWKATPPRPRGRSYYVKEKNYFWKNDWLGRFRGKKIKDLALWQKKTDTEEASQIKKYHYLEKESYFRLKSDPHRAEKPPMTTFPPPAILARAKMIKEGVWHFASQLFLKPSEIKGPPRYDEETGRLTLAWEHGKNWLGEIKEKGLYLTEKDQKGDIGLFTRPVYPADSLQTITIRARGQAPAGVEDKRAVAFYICRGEEGNYWEQHQKVTLGDLQDGRYSFPLNFSPGHRPYYFRIYRPGQLDKGDHWARKVTLEGVEIEVHMTDLAWRMFHPENYDGKVVKVSLFTFQKKEGTDEGEWVCKLNLKGKREGKVTLNKGQRWKLKVTMWNTGRASWLPTGGSAQIRLAPLGSSLPAILYEGKVVNPLDEATFSRTFPAFSKKEDLTLIWQLYLPHRSMSRQPYFGDPFRLGIQVK